MFLGLYFCLIHFLGPVQIIDGRESNGLNSFLQGAASKGKEQLYFIFDDYDRNYYCPKVMYTSLNADLSIIRNEFSNSKGTGGDLATVLNKMIYVKEGKVHSIIAFTLNSEGKLSFLQEEDRGASGLKKPLDFSNLDGLKGYYCPILSL